MKPDARIERTLESYKPSVLPLNQSGMEPPHVIETGSLPYQGSALPLS